MTDALNYGRANQALRIYRNAARRLVARTLKRENRGAGDWFGDLVLAKLPRPLADYLEHQVRGAEEEGNVKSRGGNDHEGPERFLEEKHFPHIVQENWIAFRQSLGDRDSALRQLRSVRDYRNNRVAHENGQPLSEDEVIEIIEACLSIVQRFDSSASSQLTELLTKPEFDIGSADAVPTQVPRSDHSDVVGQVSRLSQTAAEVSASSVCPQQDEVDSSATTEEESSPGEAEDEGAWHGVMKFEQERRRRAARLDRLIRQFVQAGEAQYQVDELKDTLSELGSASEQDLEDTWSELHSLRWLGILPELITEVIEASSGFETLANARDGEVGFYVEGSSKSVDLRITLEVRDR